MKLALGTVQFGLPYGIANRTGQVAPAEVAAILARARAAGVDVIDTAIAYGDSESRLGEAGVAGLRLVTKLPALPEGIDDIGAWVRNEVAGALRRLAVDRVYGLLLHRSQLLAGPHGPALAAALQGLKADGLVGKIGVSIYAPDELGPVLAACPVDLVQAPFNLVDRRLQTSGWLQRLHDAGVEVHTRSAFLQGLLLMPRADIPAAFSPWATLWDAWHAWLENHAMSAPAACLSFVQSDARVGRVVVGVDSDAQWAALIAAAQSSPAVDWPAISSLDEKLVNPSQWTSL